MKLLRLAFLLIALVLGLVGSSKAEGIPDGTQLAFRAGFPGRMGPIRSGSYSVSYAAPYLAPGAVWMGDSITNAEGAQSIANWTNFYLQGRMANVLGYNQGVSGNQTTNMLARDSTALSYLSAYSGPKFYFILAGTNDVVVGGRSSSTIITSLNQLIANGKGIADRVYLRTITSRTGITAGQATTISDVNNWIRSISDSKVTPIDYDLSGFNPTTMTVDGLHPNNIGAQELGKYTAQAVSSSLSAFNPLTVSASNLLVNPVMAGTSGTFTSLNAGSLVATSWNVRNFTGVSVSTAVQALTGRNMQVINVSGTNPNGYVEFRNFPTYSGNPGDVYDAYVSVTILGGKADYITLTSDGIKDAYGFYNSSSSNAISGTYIWRGGRTSLTTVDTANTFYLSIGYNSPTTPIISETIYISDPVWVKKN